MLCASARKRIRALETRPVILKDLEDMLETLAEEEAKENIYRASRNPKAAKKIKPPYKRFTKKKDVLERNNVEELHNLKTEAIRYEINKLITEAVSHGFWLRPKAYEESDA